MIERVSHDPTKARRVIGKAEILPKGDNPRFIVTNLPKAGQSSASGHDMPARKAD
jgi:hypothetical protein